MCLNFNFPSSPVLPFYAFSVSSSVLKRMLLHFQPANTREIHAIAETMQGCNIMNSRCTSLMRNPKDGLGNNHKELYVVQVFEVTELQAEI